MDLIKPNLYLVKFIFESVIEFVFESAIWEFQARLKNKA